MTPDFIKKIIINNLSQGLLFGSKWLLTIIALKVLNIEMFAIFSFVFSLSNILVAVMPFGGHVCLINKAENSESGIKKLGVSISIICTIFFLILFAFLFFILLGISPSNKELVFLSFFLSFFSSINTVLFSFLKGIGNFLYELKIYIIFSILMLFLIAYLYFVGTLPLSIIFFYLIFINFFITVLTFKYSSVLDPKRLYDTISFKYKDLKRNFSQQFYFGLQEVVTASYTQGGMLILFYIVSNQVYGEYRAMLILVAPFTLVNIAFSQVLLSDLKKVSFNKISSVFHRMQLPFVMLLLIVLIVFYLLGEPIVKIITGLPYTSSIHKSYIGVLCIIFTSFVYIGYEMLLVVLNKQKYRFIVMLLGAIINIITIFILLPYYGIVGAILTNVFSNLVVFIGMIIVSEKELMKLAQIN